MMMITTLNNQVLVLNTRSNSKTQNSASRTVARSHNKSESPPFKGFRTKKESYPKDKKNSIKRNELRQKGYNRNTYHPVAEPQMLNSIFGSSHITDAAMNFADLDMDALNDVLKKAGSEMPATLEHLRQIDIDALNEFVKSGHDFGQNVNPIFASVNRLTSLLSSVPNGSGVAIDLIVVAVLIFNITKLQTEDEISPLMIGVCCAYLAIKYGTQLWNIFKELFCGDKPQDLSALDVSKLLSYVIIFIFNIDDKDLVKSFFKTMFVLPKSVSGLQEMFEFVMKLIEELFNYLRRKLYSATDFRRIFSREDPYMDDIVRLCDRVEELIRQDELNASQENVALVEVTLECITKYVTRIPRNHKTSNLCTELFRLQSRYTKILDKLRSEGFMNGGYRIEPACVFFKSRPGFGKSIIMNCLSTELAIRISPEEVKQDVKDNIHHYVFYRRSGLVHYDTYNSKHVVTVCDDFGQATDSANKDTSDYLDLISMVNTVPYPLPMAELEQKGKRFFNSEVVLATTNLTCVRPVSIIDPRAVTRRIDYLIEIVPKDEYSTEGVPDRGKYPTRVIDGEEITKLTPDMVYYRITNWPDDTDIGAEGKDQSDLLTYEQLLELIMRLHARKKGYFKAMQALTKEIYAKYTKAGPLPVPQMLFENIDGEEVIVDEIDEGAKWLVPKQYLNDIDKIMSFFNGRSTIVKKMLTKNLESCCRVVEFPIGNFQEMLQDLHRHYPKSLRYAFKYCTELNPHVDHHAFGVHMEYECSVPLSALPYTTEGLRYAYNTLRTSASLAMNSFMRMIQGAIIWVATNHPLIFGMIFLVTTVTVQFLAIKGIISVLKAIVNMIFPGFNSPHSYSREAVASKIERNSKNIKMSVNRSPQLGSDPNGSDILASIAKTNCYELFEGDSRLGFITAVRERIFVVPWHFITHLHSKVQDGHLSLDTLLQIKKMHKGHERVFNIRISDMIEFHEESSLQFNDLVLVRMPRHVCLHRDITDFFLDEATSKRLNDNIDIVVTFPALDERVSVITRATFQNNKTIKDIDGTSYQLRESFMYTGVDTQGGDCGALAIYMNARIAKRKIFGIHVAGNTSSRVGFCGLITQESLRAAYNAFENIIEEIPPHEVDTEGTVPQSLFSDKFITQGTVERGPRLCTKTSIVKTPLHGIFGKDAEDSKPAAIERLFSNNLLGKMYSKYGNKPVLDNDYSREVLDELNYLENESPNYVKPSIYTYEEAVEGVDEWFRGLDRSTSSGWPYNLTRKSRKKTYFFGSEGAYDFNSTQAIDLRKLQEDYEKSCGNFVRKPQIYTGNPKDELLPAEKVDAGKLRPISGSALVSAITIRKYFGSFCSWITRNNIHNGTAIGTNPVTDWNLLASKLLSKSDEIGAGDHRGYDTNQQACVMWSICDLINLWYNDEHSAMRSMLFLEIVNSWHVVGTTVFSFWNNLPSGNVLTAIVNSFSNRIIFRKCWNMLLPGVSFSDNVYLCALGDDNIFSVASEYSKYFNEFTIIEPMSQQGYDYTTESKIVLSCYTPRRITEVEFLKRGFHFNVDLNAWAGPTRLSRTLAFSYWVRNDEPLVVKDLVENTMRELCLGGREVFEKYVPTLLEHYRKHYRSDYGWFKHTDYSGVLDAVHN